MRAGLRSGIRARGRAGYGAATASGLRRCARASAAGSGRSGATVGSAPARKTDSGSAGRSPGNMRDLGAAVEDVGRRPSRPASGVPMIDGRRLAAGASRSPRASRAPRRARARRPWRRRTAARSMARCDEPGEDRLQPVVVAVVEVVGLGRGEEDAVDPPRDQAGQPAGPAEAEGGEDVGERRLEVGDRRRSGVQRLERVDQHDLAVEAGEVLAEERPHDRRSCRPRSGAPSCAASEPAGSRSSPRVERREGQRRRAVEVARHQEAARRQRREAGPVGAAGAEIVGEAARRARAPASRPPAPSGRRSASRASQRAAQSRPRRACAAAATASRDQVGVVLGEQRQVEQPLAGIVDDVEVEPAAADGAGEERGRTRSAMVRRSSLIWRVESGQMRSSTSAATWRS